MGLLFFTALPKRRCRPQWHFSARSSIAPRLAIPKNRMPHFNHDQINFHYLARPPGGASPTTLVFQHGLGGDTERVFELLGPLPGFSLVGLDCRGHGKTTPLGAVEKLSFDSFADDVVALLDRLGVRQAIVGGTSMGAGVALNCAIRYPQRVVGLVLLRP